ncbi:hypothetical protein PIB30_008568 [Stylosanthes scabra]|uniref:adenine phosphoribosyltransferase n=1 Tax=Stylosanthes scabra TaxID=79078 RepID=A0ABU6Q633_9FABA|nr:hypothetical protein [Stylosanthes scabra]
MSAYREEDPRLHGIKTKIRVVPHFPKSGIMFQDITTLLLDPKAFKDTIDLFVERYKGKNINVVAGIEARGFIFGPPIALAIGAKFVPLRKPKKLPGKVISQEYILEYGRDCLEMHVGAVEAGERALVVDDLIATGGTLCAAMDLLERVGAEVVECACVIELPELKGRERLNGKPLYVLVEYLEVASSSSSTTSSTDSAFSYPSKTSNLAPCGSASCRNAPQRDPHHLRQVNDAPGRPGSLLRLLIKKYLLERRTLMPHMATFLDSIEKMLLLKKKNKKLNSPKLWRFVLTKGVPNTRCGGGGC